MPNPKDRAGAKKPSLSVLPLAVLYEVAIAIYEGARKYGPWNWRAEKVDTMIYVDAAKRHLDWYTCHEDIDPDSGLHHIDKAIAGLMVLSDAIKHDCAVDTRPPKQNLDQAQLMAKIEAVNERYPVPAVTPGTIDVPRAAESLRNVTVKLSEEKSSVDLTEQQAEKAAEAYGITDLIEANKEPNYDFTQADNGDYILSSADIDKNVERRDGTEGTITGCDDQNSDGSYNDKIPIYVVWHDEDEYETYIGTDGRDADGYGEDYDIVKVFHPSVDTVPEGDDTVAGGGDYVITPQDVGKKAITRDGSEVTLAKFEEDESWPVALAYPEESKSQRGFHTVTASGWGGHSANFQESRGMTVDTRDYDVVKVLH